MEGERRNRRLVNGLIQAGLHAIACQPGIFFKQFSHLSSVPQPVQTVVKNIRISE